MNLGGLMLLVLSCLLTPVPSSCSALFLVCRKGETKNRRERRRRCDVMAEVRMKKVITACHPNKTRLLKQSLYFF